MPSQQHSDASPAPPAPQGRPGKAALRPALYASLVAFVLVATFVYELRTKGVFACPATGYAPGTYLAYCNSTGYGDYDHGALWFGFEPEATRAAAEADVLFLGSSRMQFAFSTEATEKWSAGLDASYYLLGFSHTETVTFTGPLVSALSPRARAYVVNVDRFFEDTETPPAAAIFHGEDVESRYRRKRLWQYPHRALCAVVPVVCGDKRSFFRARDTGSWTFQGKDDDDFASDVGDAPASAAWQFREDLATAFIDALPVPRECVFLSLVPSGATPRAESADIAAALDMDLLSPKLEGLRTFDGSHLDDRSAERWSARFFELHGNRLSRCLDEPADKPADGPRPSREADAADVPLASGASR